MKTELEIAKLMIEEIPSEPLTAVQKAIRTAVENELVDVVVRILSEFKDPEAIRIILLEYTGDVIRATDEALGLISSKAANDA